MSRAVTLAAADVTVERVRAMPHSLRRNEAGYWTFRGQVVLELRTARGERVVIETGVRAFCEQGSGS